MNNQTFTSYNTSIKILLRKVEIANEIILQATKWNSEAIDLQNEAKKEREDAKSAKKNRWLIPLFSPLAILSNPLIGLLVFIIATIVVWLPKN